MNQPRFTKPVISVVIPAYNSVNYLTKCLASLRASTLSNFEVVVSDDGSTDDTAEVAHHWGAIVVSADKTSGPACARNRGVAVAKAPIIYFVDSDVCVQPDTLERIVNSFDADPELDALIGSYDDAPGSPDFVSKYRNLMHCYVHQQAERIARTFWSGCGAIRRTVFLQMGGFDESYGKPSVEDIELGYRLSAAGKKIVLDRDLQVKHLKHWSLAQVVRTDILQRGIPWTELILRNRAMPNDLNLKLGQRLSVFLIFVASLIAAWSLYQDRQSFVLSVSMLTYLLFVQAYFWSSRKLQPSRLILAVGSTAAVLATSWDRFPVVGVGIVAVWAVAFIRQLIPDGALRRATGTAFGLGLVGLAVAVLATIPQHPVTFGFFVALAMIVVLNSDFYLFLAKRTGKLASLAAIPFHLLFFFYSGLSFVLGAMKFAFAPRQQMQEPAVLTPTWPTASPQGTRIAPNRF